MTTLVISHRSYSFSEDYKELYIALGDENGDGLALYTIDVATGVGTDTAGNTVDLSTYYKEPNYFMPYDYIGEVAEIYFFEQTGTRAGSRGMLTDVVDNTVEITIYDNNGGTAEVYTINAETGIGTDKTGAEVDLSAYADYKPLEDSDLFVPKDILTLHIVLLA